MAHTSQSLREVRAGGQAGAEAGTIEEGYLQASSSCLPILLLIHTRTTCPEVAPSPSPGPLASIISQENNPIDLPPVQSDGGVFSAEVLFPQVTLACALLTKPHQDRPAGLSVEHRSSGLLFLLLLLTGYHIEWVVNTFPSLWVQLWDMLYQWAMHRHDERCACIIDFASSISSPQ